LWRQRIFFNFMIIPPSRSNRDNVLIKAAVDHFGLPKTKACLIFVRSYYLDTMGVKGKGDQNIYDDACYLISPDGIESYNANTEPTVNKKGSREIATLNLGKYKFYKGKHKGKYNALRPYPEGVILKCMR